MAELEPYGVTEMFVKGEPYRQVKIRARYMLSGVITLPTALTILDRLIESAPQQTLDALCEVIDPD